MDKLQLKVTRDQVDVILEALAYKAGDNARPQDAARAADLYNYLHYRRVRAWPRRTGAGNGD